MFMVLLITKIKSFFLVELVYVLRNKDFPVIIGGDFNIIRKSNETNRKKVLSKWSRLFNAVIGNCELKEVELYGRRFTWCNGHEDPTFEKLDRILVSVDWEAMFPLLYLNDLPMTLSEHAPLVLDFGLNHPKIARPFRFELCSLMRDDLDDLIKKLRGEQYCGRNLQGR